MSLLLVLSIGVVLAISIGPVLLLKRGPDGPMPPAIVRNAWIAYAARVSLFVPLFMFGAAGDVWPALAGALGFAAGLYLLGVLRRRTAAQGATSSAVLASSSGVQLATGLASVVALMGLAGAEAAALGIVAQPFLGESSGIALFLALVCAAGTLGLAAGATNILYIAQALLGAIFLGLIGAVALLIYLIASDLRPLPPHGALALVLLAASCVALLVYRQTKYVETPLLAAPETKGWRRALARQVRSVQRLANVAVSVSAGFSIVLAGMVIYVLGPGAIARDALAALGTAPQVPPLGCAAIALLAGAYPLADAVTWQSADALGGSERRTIRFVAGEAGLFAVVAASVGAVATLATDLPTDSIGITDFIRQLMVFDHPITDATLALLMVGLVAMTTVTMSMAAAAALRIVRLDILPSVPSGAGRIPAPVATAAIGIATTIPWLVASVPTAGTVDARLFAIALGFAVLQLAGLPLLVLRLRGIVLPSRVALGGPVGGIAAALACLATHAATGEAIWLWLAIPASLAPGLALGLRR